MEQNTGHCNVCLPATQQTIHIRRHLDLTILLNQQDAAYSGKRKMTVTVSVTQLCKGD